MPWKFNSHEAVFLQIASRLRGEILRGKYLPDEQIPPVRQLAFEAAVNPNTMQKALSVLEEEGLLYSRGTVGRFVTTDRSVLALCGERVRREAVHRLVEEAFELGITKEELLRYIQEEGGIEDEKSAGDPAADGGNA